jgi:ERCC4-type nuclease
MKLILDSLTIIVDTREKLNDHVTDYFKAKKIPHAIRTMKTGDYSSFIPKNEELGITRDIYLESCLERKRNVDEIIGNLSKDKRTTFENELIRASKHPFVLIVEDEQGYEKILRGDYRSQYEPKALLGSLKTMEARYDFSIVYLNPTYTGNYIYYHFYYQAKELLKRGLI